ncbi:DUF6804 family protein [Herbiconiux sp. YIM B11900]|uniref:DUF6804 family protein n=1 Tax=Herbiconiux sp. YIM B11900 TaxID=3404131 RepID=UPI003F844101
MLPAVLGAIVLLASIGLTGTDFYLYVRYAVSILALIVVVIAIQHRRWWWGLPMLPLAVVWNPAWPFNFTEELWQILVLVGSAVFIAAGVAFRVIDTSVPPANRPRP